MLSVTAESPNIRLSDSSHLALRKLAVIAAILLAETLCLSIWLDAADLENKSSAATLIGFLAPWIVRFSLAFAASGAALAIVGQPAELAAISRQFAEVRWARPFGAVHVAAITLFALLSHFLFRTPVRGANADILLTAWTLAGMFAVASLALFGLPSSAWFRMLLKFRRALLCACIAALAVCFTMGLNARIWNSAVAVTFQLVKALLGCFLPAVIAEPGAFLIGTRSFQVEIAPQCSGLEGVALVVVFLSLWLLFFRRDFRFPIALALLPAGAIAVFGLNAVRIATLILIGNAGASGIALGGFHSQAGWISFIVVALALCAGSQHVPMIRAVGTKVVAPANSTAVYLTPFLAILAASMLTHAASANFEWLYPLRVIAAVVTIWYFRASYRDLDWRVGYLGPSIGILVFLLWILPPSASAAMPHALAVAAPSTRNLWILFRCIGGIATVPIAEELAFRGFLLRRLIAADFDSVSCRRFTWLALIASSLIFGAMHGDRWLAGTVAGLLYALAMLRQGRIGEAVAAHATTNALLAIWVLARGQWGYW